MKNGTSPRPPSSPQTTLDTPAALLWMSAFILFGLLIVQASRLGVGNEALAGDSASSVGDLSALTVSDGDDQEILLVLDGREQQLFVYTISGGRMLNAPTVVDIDELFHSARGSSPEDTTPARRGR